jgi:hypothetical protein
MKASYEFPVSFLSVAHRFWFLSVCLPLNLIDCMVSRRSYLRHACCWCARFVVQVLKWWFGGFYSWALKLEDDHPPTASSPIAVHNKLLYFGEITVYGAVSHLLDFGLRRRC